MSDIRPYRLESFDAGSPAKAAGPIKAAARAGPKALSETTRREVGKIRDEARREGAEAGRASAWGTELRRIGIETAGLQHLLRSIAVSLHKMRAQFSEEQERALVRLAVAIAERIVKVEARSGAKVVQANVRRAMELSACQQDLEIQLNPADRAVIDTYLPQLQRDFADIGMVRLTASETIARGGCVVVTKHGTVDADIKTQLDEIERGLLG